MIQHFSTLEAYCKGIGISKPKSPNFDIRSFQENMKTVSHQMAPFKHEFYALAIKLDGSGFAKTGNFSTENKKTTVFFNSPYQILQWNIAPDWEGFYVIFSEDFYRGANRHRGGQALMRITEDFPFLLIDNTIPLEMDTTDAMLFAKVFEDVYTEHRSTKSKHSEEIIRHYLHILLHKVARLYDYAIKDTTVTTTQRTQDLATVSRFKTLLDVSFRPNQNYGNLLPNQVQFYADKLNLHPNHFNAVVKRITDKSASEIIYKYILNLSKSKLANTTKSVKEIAFDLHYNYPNHFANFFKKQIGMTPSQYRKTL